MTIVQYDIEFSCTLLTYDYERLYIGYLHRPFSGRLHRFHTWYEDFWEDKTHEESLAVFGLCCTPQAPEFGDLVQAHE